MEFKSLIAQQKNENHLQKIEQQQIANAKAKEALKEQELKELATKQEQEKKKRALLAEDIKNTKDDTQSIIKDIANLNNPVSANFNSDYEVASQKYVYLLEGAEEANKNVMEIRARVLPLPKIFALEASVAILFIVIIMRLIGENETLLESFTFVTAFQYIFSGLTGLLLDFFIQDIFLITSISMAISLLCKDSDYIYSNDVVKHSLYVFIGAIIGLFISSILYGL